MALNSFSLRPLRWLPLASLCLTSLYAQGSGHLSTGQPGKISGKRGAEVETRIPLTVDAGFHVNSNKPAEEYLIPLKLTWTSLGALEGGEVVYPKPSLEKYEFAEKPLSVYSGAIELVARFKVAAGAPAGPGAATGKLHYQACSSKACYPPKTIDLTIPYSVE